MHAIIREGVIEALPPGRPFQDAAGTQHPASVLALWSAAELAAIGVYPIEDDPIPEGKVATDFSLERDGEVVRRRWTLEDAPPPPPIRRIAPLAFRRRFPAAKRGAITLAAAQALAAGDPTLQVFLDDLSSARFVDLDDPETAAGVGALVAAGLLTPEEGAAMLADGTAAETEGLAS